MGSISAYFVNKNFKVIGANYSLGLHFRMCFGNIFPGSKIIVFHNDKIN